MIFKKDPTMETEKIIMEVTKREALSIFSERYADKKASPLTWMVYIIAGLMVLGWLLLGDESSYSICLPVAAMVLLFVHAMIGVRKLRKAARAAYSEHRAL